MITPNPRGESMELMEILKELVWVHTKASLAEDATAASIAATYSEAHAAIGRR